MSQQSPVPPLNLVRTLFPGGVGTQVQRPIYGPREPGDTSGDLCVSCDASPCSLFRPWSQTLEHDKCGQHAGRYCCLAWIILWGTLDWGQFSSVSVSFQIPMIITTASLTGLILGSLAIFPQVFNVIICSESRPGGGPVKEGAALWTNKWSLLQHCNLLEDVRSQPKWGQSTP